MDWGFIIHHLLSGYIPVMVGLALYFAVMRASGKRQNTGHILVSYIFCFYLVGILTMTGVCIRGSFSPEVVYIPFADMVRGPVDTILNVLLFVPLGIFLPLLYERYDSMQRIALTALLISFSVETAQMFGMGASDINDLITNTVGACFGYCLYRMLCGMIPGKRIKGIRIKGSRSYGEPILFWAGSMMIMLTVQIFIFHALF